MFSLTLALSSSSFLLPHHLSYLIDHQQITSEQLAQAKLLKLPAYYHFQRRHHQVGSSPWLKASQVLAIKNAAIASQIAAIYDDFGQYQRATFWYQQAIKLNAPEIRIALADLFTKQQRYQQALNTLLPIVNTNQQATIKATKLMIALGRPNDIESLLSMLTSFPAGATLVNQLNTYSILNDSPTLEAKPSQQDEMLTCIANIQMFASSLDDLDYLASLIAEFERHPLGPYLCFDPIRYLSIKNIDCYHRNQNMIRCNDSMWLPLINSITTTYIGLMLPNGGANVNAGIMYLDRHDSIDVFAHEVAHLLGFVDEYPLPENHAKCAQQQAQPFAHNVAVLKRLHRGEKRQLRNQILVQVPWRALIDDNTPIMTFDKNNNAWQLGTPIAFEQEVGLFISDTCQVFAIDSRTKPIDFTSFKPMKNHTQLTYFELDFPELYRQIFKTNKSMFLMPSAKHTLSY